jgi:hypothetical protein
MHIRNVQRLHQAELSSIPNEEKRHQRLVELNVQEACMNLFANPVVQKKQVILLQCITYYNMSHNDTKEILLLCDLGFVTWTPSRHHCWMHDPSPYPHTSIYSLCFMLFIA